MTSPRIDHLVAERGEGASGVLRLAERAAAVVRRPHGTVTVVGTVLLVAVWGA